MPPRLVDLSKPKTRAVPKQAIECPVCRDYGVIELRNQDREHCLQTLAAAIDTGEATLCACESGKIWAILLKNSESATEKTRAKMPEFSSADLEAVEQRMWDRSGGHIRKGKGPAKRGASAFLRGILGKFQQ